MRRREVIVAITGALAWPQSVCPQAAKLHRIGYLGGASLAQSRRVLDAFQGRLKELGYVEGRTITIDYRFADGEHDRLPQLAAELVQTKVDLLVAAPTQAVVAAKDATKTIPIVMIGAPDPVALGWMDNLTRPSGNLTGLTFTVGVETFAKELELLREVSPDVRLVAVLFDPLSSPAQRLVIERIKDASNSLSVQLLLLEARGPEDFEGAFALMANEGAGALLVVADNNYMRQAARLANLALQHRLPSIYQIRFPVEAGALMSYGPNVADQWARAAEYVDKLLKGAKIGDLPVQQPTKFNLVINARTAKALGLTIPPTLLARADEVIE
jgi:putative tryptophan/tyrosine transport system substrate-binding protein